MPTANRLLDVLTEQLSVVRELQQVMQDEQQAISRLDTTLMNVLNSQKEGLIINQRKVAEALRLAMTETAGQLGLTASATLSDIIVKMPVAMGYQIERLQHEVKRIATDVSILAKQNRGMQERFLSVVDDSLAFILRTLSTSNTYGARGTYLSNAQAGAVMVNREA